jgi:hypothetical protein
MDIQTYQLTVDETLVENVINLSTIIPSSTGLSNKGGWQGVITNQQIDWVESVRFNIEQITKKKTERFWFNINGPGHFNDWHRHFSNCDAAVLYIKIPPQSGNIEFREQEEILSITPTVGTLFVFPGMLEHRVTVNNSQDFRISLATNLK